MLTVTDPNLTLVTPTPLNGSRPGTPQANNFTTSVNKEALNEDRSLKKAWITCGSPLSGIFRDIKARLPYYVRDWTDAYNYRVIPATAMVFFAK